MEWNGYFFFDSVRVVDVFGDIEEFGILVVFMIEVSELVIVVMVNGGSDSYGFDVGNGGWVFEEIDGSREWRF